MLVCKIPLLARRTRPMQPVGQARRATIGYLVYKNNAAGRPSAARDERISCIQADELYVRYLCLCDALGLKAEQPVGQARRATIGYLVYKQMIISAFCYTL